MGHKSSLNRQYRIVWNESQQAWVAVSELAKGQGKSKSNGSSIKQAIMAVATATVLAGQMMQPATAQFTPDVNGGYASNEVVENGAQTVRNSGTTSNITVNISGIQQVNNGGTTYDTTVNSGGTQNIRSGGETHSTIINSGGRQNILSSGGLAIDTVVNEGGYQYVYSSGVAAGTTISSGGNQILVSGGQATSALVSSGGTQHVSAGGVANDTTLEGIYNQTDPASNAAFQRVSSGGIANGTIINSGGEQRLYGGTADSATLNTSGIQRVYAGGSAIDTVFNGGFQYIHSGGIVSDANVGSGGQTVLDGGLAQDTILFNSGEQRISSGGIASGTQLQSGGNQYVFAGGSAVDTQFNGGGQYLNSGAVVSGANVSAGRQYIRDGGTSIDTVVQNSGSRQDVVSGGIASGTTVKTGGIQYLSGGSAVGTVIINSGSQYVFAGGIAEDTSIQGLNSYQQILSGGQANSTTVGSGAEQRISSGGFASDTTVDALGTLRILDGGEASGVQVSSGGRLLISSGGILGGNTYVAGSLQGDGSITNNGALTLDQALNQTFAFDMSGTGSLDKQGSNTLILNGSNTYTGGTTVTDGKLVVGGSTANSTAQVAGNVDVNTGAALAGYGTVTGQVRINNGATLGPGYNNTAGTLTVGQATLDNGSIFEVDADPSGVVGKLVANSSIAAPGTPNAGTVTINSGAIMNIQGGAGTWDEHFSYVIIDTDNGVTGTFTNVTSNLAFLTSIVDYNTPNQVRLTLTRNSTGFEDIAETENEKSTGGAIEDLGPGDEIYDTIVSMDASQARDAFNNLSGEIHASLKSALLTNSRYARYAVWQHLSSETGLLDKPLDTHKNLWVSSWVHDGHLKADGNAEKVNNDGWGVLIGNDFYREQETVMGLALGFEHTDLSIGGTRHSDADIDAIHLMGYGRTSIGKVDIKGGIGYSWLDIDTTRHIDVGSLASKNTADYHGQILQVFIQGSHTFELNEQTNLMPFVGLTYQNIRTDSFTEKGGVTALRNHARNDDQVISTLGVQAEWKLRETLSLQGSVEWQHNFSNITPKTTMSFSGGRNYNIKGVEVNRDSAIIGMGANLKLTPNASLYLGYEGEFGDQGRDHAGKILWQYRF